MCDVCDLGARRRIDRRALLRKGLIAGGGVALGPALLVGGSAGAAGAATTHPEREGMGEDPPVYGAAQTGAAGRTVPVIDMPAPRIATRAEWGADESIRRGTPSFAPLTKLIVHHTVTPNGADPADQLRRIQRYHVNTNGWNDIAYNILIDHTGRIWEGRYARQYAPGEPHSGEDTEGRGVIGGHSAGHNTGTCGVSLLGTFETASASPAMMLALRQVLAWKAGRHGINPLGRDPYTRVGDGGISDFPNIAGHRDVRQTACPGARVYGELAGLRGHVSLRCRRGLVGYRILSSDGTVSSFGGAFDFDLGRRVADAVAVAAGPHADAYWILDRAGGVTPRGLAGNHGSLTRSGIRARAVDMAATATGRGYWIMGADGGIFTYGDALFAGSVPALGVTARTIRLRANPGGPGYWVLGEDGGIFCFGGAGFYGSLPGVGVGTRVVDLAPTPTGRGYWILAADGGVFSFGDARFHGSIPALRIRWAKPARAIMASAAGDGYHVLASDGGVFSFGKVPFHGSLAGSGRTPISIAPAVQA